MKNHDERRLLADDVAEAWAAAGYVRDKAERWHDAGAETPAMADSLREMGITANEAAWPTVIEGVRSSLASHFARGSVTPTRAITMVRSGRRQPPRSCESCGWPFTLMDETLCQWCDPARATEESRRLLAIEAMK